MLDNNTSIENENVKSSKRANFNSRLGFIMIAAGCAVGLGNVWRFPFITGQYGGAAFIILYLIFLLVLGIPIMAMEFAVGRASKKSTAQAFNVLEKPGSKWHIFKWFSFAGQLILMMFYTCVAGWMIAYTFKTLTGAFDGKSVEVVSAEFPNMLADPVQLFIWTFIAIVIGIAVCIFGLNKGVERITKPMMLILFALIIILAIMALFLPGAGEGIEFYLKPDFSKLFASPQAFGEAAYAAMGQAFFTLSVGMGSMAIFGSYLGKERTLGGEALVVGGLDTFIAIMAGLIIFPACFSYGIDPGAGPSLIFVSLSNVFAQMPLGVLWGTLFFIFMSFAALSTVIAVFEGIIAFIIDQWGLPRIKATLIFFVAITILSLPCILGFNVLSGVVIPGIGDIQSVEDFIVSNNILVLGGLVFLLFCTLKAGWGWKNYLKEANTGSGPKIAEKVRIFTVFGAGALLVIVFIMGWIPIISTWFGA
ncbi:MAG: sodium-dependent transporter [Coriobacteriales bacterium]|nr:sodium-dependent transporter [Coriobacteriales bacterium]